MASKTMKIKDNHGVAGNIEQGGHAGEQQSIVHTVFLNVIRTRSVKRRESSCSFVVCTKSYQRLHRN
ncbi:hypothetical protein GCK32_008565 [Trichostrongylus colubriformis]|uniref:Uncharacterized protein n=1 Tax=Trichostrongylus colubriformis TaxID=6319 RepID=A0AAN8FMW7_TRICO